MKLAFYKRFRGMTFKEVPVTLKIGTLEDTCEYMGLEFWQAGEASKSGNDFVSELLYQGYLTACKESFKKPKYDRIKSIIWYENMSQTAQKEFTEMISGLYGKITGKEDKKKVE